MVDNTGAFADLFSFSRARAADYTDAYGQTQIAPVDTPRLDHDGGGTVLGLLVEARIATGAADLTDLKADALDVMPTGAATVLHDYVRPGGARAMTAYYTYDAAAMVRARLNMCGWHRRLMVFPKHLERSDLPAGPIRYGGESWDMAGLILVAAKTALSIDGEWQTALIEA